MDRYIKRVSFMVTILAIISYIYFDRAIALYSVNEPKVIKDIFSFITNFGLSQYYLIPSLLLFFISLIYCNKKFANAFLYIFTTVALSGILSIILKVIFARYRPPKFINDHLYGFNWFDFGYIVNSFPSGHSITALSAYTAFALLIPRLKWLFLSLGVLIAISRVMVGVHYFSDILIGSLIGFLSSIYLYKKFYGG